MLAGIIPEVLIIISNCWFKCENLFGMSLFSMHCKMKFFMRDMPRGFFWEAIEFKC